MSTVSTTINEVKITGCAERVLIDKAAKLWQRISRWTHSSDVEFDDGKTAQEKVGAINGITSNFEDGSIDIAASSVLTKSIKDDLNDGIINERIQLVIQDDGNLGWKKDGADTVIPFSNIKNLKIERVRWNYIIDNAPRDYAYMIIWDNGHVANQDERYVAKINGIDVNGTGIIKKGDNVCFQVWGRWASEIILCSFQ